MKDNYFVTVILLIFLALAGTLTIRNLNELIAQKDHRIQQLIQELELMRGYQAQCITENSDEFILENLMKAFVPWTPMTDKEISYWREKEEDRG